MPIKEHSPDFFFGRTMQKGASFASYSSCEWKDAQKFMGRFSHTIHTDCEAEQFWRKYDTLRRVRKGLSRTLPTTTKQLKSFAVQKIKEILKKPTEGYFFAWLLCVDPCNKTVPRYIGSTQSISAEPCSVSTELSPFRLPILCISGTGAC